MEPTDNEIKLYSEEVRDVLSDPPKTIFRWGNSILLLFVCSLLLIAYFIQYPDVVTAPITITTATPPQKLIAKTSGKIQDVLVTNFQTVKQNTPLAVIENAADYKEIFKLESLLNKGENYIESFPFSKFKNAQLGDIESAFTLFEKEFETHLLNKKLQPFKVEANAQNIELNQLYERLKALLSQKEITIKELEIQKIDLDRYEHLFKKGIVSSQEFEKQKLAFLQSQKNYKNLLTTVSQIQSSINDANKKTKTNTINELKENTSLDRNLVQAYYQLKKTIKDWELQYVLRSGIAGKITFLQVWTKNQNVVTSDNLFAIIPEGKNQFLGKLKAPAVNSGKIKLGQTVNIKLINYPDREFGVIKGIIKNISLTPDKDGNLLIDIVLPNGLETSYKKQIRFQQEMLGNGDIITEDLCLLERILYQFRDLF